MQPVPSDKEMAFCLTPVSRETELRLDELVNVLIRWQKVQNLVSAPTLQQVWTRHIADALQLIPLVPQRKRWIDLGSGGGFPALAIAAAMSENQITEIHLIESNVRKCAFLREAARAMGVAINVHPVRVEDIIDQFVGHADVVSARALAGLPQLIGWTHKLLTKGTVGLFPKGRDLTNELTETTKCWRLDYTIHNSLTDQTGRILRITGAHPV